MVQIPIFGITVIGHFTVLGVNEGLAFSPYLCSWKYKSKNDFSIILISTLYVTYAVNDFKHNQQIKTCLNIDKTYTEASRLRDNSKTRDQSVKTGTRNDLQTHP